MTAREILFAIAIAVSLIAVVRGVYLYSEPAAWIVGGIGLAGWSWSVLAGDERPGK